jgi:AbrB family looped-hinge helix DNA binding protein
MKETYRVDKQGRVLIPSNIRQRLNIQPDSEVTVDADKNSVCIRLAQDYCSVCGSNIKGNRKFTIGIGENTKMVCHDCALKIVNSINKGV